MTRERIRAEQASKDPVSAKFETGTVRNIGVHTVVVQLSSGANVTGQRVDGLNYTINGRATCLMQQPAVGPVFPIT